MNLDAFIFVPALVGSVVFGFVFALFAAHNYLTVLQSTGSGAKHVTWVSEPILDHFWKLFYLAWLIGLPIGCVVFVTSALIYARLLGRLAFVLAFTRSFMKRKKKREPAESKQQLDPSPSEYELTQPSDLPPVETPYDGPVTGYDIT